MILPKAPYEWMHLCLQDFKSVSEYVILQYLELPINWPYVEEKKLLMKTC